MVRDLMAKLLQKPGTEFSEIRAPRRLTRICFFVWIRLVQLADGGIDGFHTAHKLLKGEVYVLVLDGFRAGPQLLKWVIVSS